MKFCFNLIIATVVFALAGIPAYSAELAILRNGFAIRHERREPRELVTRLYLTAAPGNYVDVSTGEIAGYEKIDPPEPPVLPATPAVTLEEIVNTASSRNHLDPDLVMSLIRAESGFDPRAASPKGAKGLMQLMPRTAVLLGVDNAVDPVANVEGGTRYLRALLNLFDDDLIKALAAYNAGPERVAQYRGVPPYSETRTYIARILSDFNRKQIDKKARGKNWKVPRVALHGGSRPASKSREGQCCSAPQSLILR